MTPRIAVLIGMLLLPGHASAQLTAEQLSELPPVSQHYTRTVVERAQAGIDHANADDGTVPPTIFQFFFDLWLDNVSSAVLALMDTELHIETQHRDLLENTPCLHLDIVILQAMIEKANGELHRAFDQRRPVTMVRLISVIRFLNQRIEHLTKGARDPLYEDTEWNTRRLFDPADPEETRMCPFHSDYLPPVESGYGCDVAAIPAAAAAHAPTLKERTALDAFMQAREALMNQVRRNFAALTGAPAAAGVREHRVLRGCLRDNMEEWIAYGTGETLMSRLRIAAYELRGPFSLEKDETNIALRFAQWIRRWGSLRPQADNLKLPSEFPPGPEREAAEEREEKMDPLQHLVRWGRRTYFRAWSLKTTPQDILPLLRSHELMLALESSGTGRFREATERITALATKLNGGIRGFARDQAYFLRRSCVYRPCNKRLERILKIVFADECFPYANGQYAGGAAVHETCKAAAEIEEGEGSR